MKYIVILLSLIAVTMAADHILSHDGYVGFPLTTYLWLTITVGLGAWSASVLGDFSPSMSIKDRLVMMVVILPITTAFVGTVVVSLLIVGKASQKLGVL